MTDYNQSGVEYEMVARAEPEDWFEIIRPSGRAFITTIQDELSSRVTADPSDERSRAYSRLLARTSAIAIHFRKIAELIESSSPSNMTGQFATMQVAPPMMASFNDVELTVVCEALLFQAAATLDSASNMIAKTVDGFQLPLRGQRPSRVYYSNVQVGLRRSLRRDARSAELSRLIDECNPTLSTFLIGMGRTTVRNYLAHQGALQDLNETNFVVHWLADGRALRFDAEVSGVHLIRGMKDVFWTSIYFASKVIAILAGWDTKSALSGPLADHWRVTRSAFEPVWRHDLIAWRDYISQSIDDPTFTVVRLTETGAELNQVRLRQQILDEAK